MTLRPSAREVAIWLAIKLVLLILIYVLFFRPSMRPHVDTPAHILGPASSSAP